MVGLTNGVAAIAAGNTYTCALTTRGAVKCWGASHLFADASSLNPVRSSLIPAEIAGLETGVTAIAASYAHACALTAGGGVKCWGPNHRGELGNGTTTEYRVPVNVSGLASGVTAIGAGLRHTCAVTSEGRVKCWGANGYGQLGTGSTIDSSVPVDVSGLAGGVTAMGLGHIHTCALSIGGGVACWGSNGFGQLGSGTINRLAPVGVEGLARGVTAIAGGASHTCARTSDGQVSCWGDNQFGQLGNGTTTNSRVPVAVDTAIPEPTATSIATPSLPPSPASASLPVRGSARATELGIQLAPAADGTLWVTIPAPGDSVLLALLDRSGRLSPGWPTVLDGATRCGQLLPVEDGSVRVLCTPEELNRELNSGARAFAFGSTGRSLVGWPVDIPGFFVTGRVIGDDLTLYASRSLGDVEIEGQPSADAGIVTVAADGVLVDGARITSFDHCCRWAVGPDGIAYGAASVIGPDQEPADASRITALDLSGIRVGWPVSFDGITSVPAFGPGVRVVLSVGSSARRTTRVLAFNPDGQAVAASSPELPILTAEIVTLDGPYECGLPTPPPPLVAQDGTIFVFSEIDTAIVGLDASLEVIGGWPYRPPTPLTRRDPGHPEGDLSCPSLAIPAVGPESTLYLPLAARDANVGGSLVAVGSDARVRPGWPVGLGRAGAEFWSIVVGSDGTIYALAIEPETGDGSSATILAITPDSTVLYTTTIVDP